MKIRRFINKNSTAIGIVLIVSIFCFLGIKLLNYYYEEQEKENSKKYGENSSYSDKNYTIGNNYTIDNLQEDKVSGLTGNSIENVMKLFVTACNNGKVDEAYTYLTDDCKRVFGYTSAEEFDKYYLKNRFSEKQEYSIVKWSQNGNMTTYLVNFYGDMLATGGEKSSVKEYYTFVENDEIYKININNFIYSKNKNIEYNENDIYIKIGNVNVFESYEEAEVEIRNTSNNKIGFLENKTSKRLHLENNVGTEYSAVNCKFDFEDVIINSKDIENYKVRFNKSYSISNKVKYFVFEDVILNYDEYLDSNDKSNYANRLTIKLEY